MAPGPPDFQKFISDARERKRNEVLANSIFSRNRRQSAPSKLKSSASLASRVGVNKRVASASHPAQQHAGNTTTTTTTTKGNHDLLHTPGRRDKHQHNRRSIPANISAPPNSASRRAAKLASAMDRMDVDQVNVSPAPTGISIRGLAGPFSVTGYNFAPGTTAADIEHVMTPVGGDMVSCTIVKKTPVVTAQMVFVTRDGGDNVIKTFHNQTADGRVLKLYPTTPAASHAARHLVDGKMGFPESESHYDNHDAHYPDDTADDYRAHNDDNNNNNNRDLTGPSMRRSPNRGGRPLYSDRIVNKSRRN